jgi:hypothetical protein
MFVKTKNIVGRGQSGHRRVNRLWSGHALAADRGAEPSDHVKQRQRGPSVLERRRMAEIAAAPLQKSRVSSDGEKQSAPQVSSAGKSSPGKSMKTGMVLARAELSQSSSGVVAARDRQTALVGKGLYREAEKVAREAPVGMLSTKDMPKRKDSAQTEAEYEKTFGSWMRSTLEAKVSI